MSMNVVQITIVLVTVCAFTQSLLLVEKDVSDRRLQVRIESGVLQGARGRTVDRNVTYYKFLGIPYAEPPVGPLRWKPPVKFGKWSGILNATVEPPMCIQLSTDIGLEDCLFINVYTPQNLNESRLVPVLVYIYGGRFVNGVANYTVYGPDYLLSQRIAFVSFNYRMGVFGFLSTQDAEMPGNYGLKDQVEVLRWVNNNIHHFGGDPNNVTIFGDSAGAASVGYHLLIPQSRGLFHRAISASGSALCPWAFQREPKRIAMLLGLACGIFESNMTVFVERMRQEDAKKLRSRSIPIHLGTAMEPLNGLPFAPCVEPKLEEAVLTNRSNDLFAAGKFNIVPYMIGFTSQEAAIVQDVIELSRPYIAHWDLMPQLIVPVNLNCTTKVKRKEVAMKIKNYYFGRKYISMSTKTEMMNFIGDSQFVRAIRHNVQICAAFTDVYLYVFSYEGYLGRFGTKHETLRKVKGAGHVEDLFYIFRTANLATTNRTELEVINTMTHLWANFIKVG
ncbi:PREDICTED: esterase FE4-like, partial [Nicrophorus vespilloides]|uniref:Carboxylic ester hydrolase n=1 Tax=Nicrophorus vespilloides TaxID=110193 RepID=A0ABM1MVM1_NICVS